MKTLIFLITNLIFVGCLYCQNEWTFYNGDQALLKQAGGVTQSATLQERLFQVHSDNNGNDVGSVYLLRKQQTDFWDKIAITRDGFLILVFKGEGSFLHWVLVKVNSKPWLEFIHSIVPANSNVPLATRSMKRFLTKPENEALSKLMDKVKSIYCRASDTAIDSLVSIFNSSEGIDIDELKRLEREEETKRMTQERQQRLGNGVPSVLRIIVYNDKYYLMDPEDGFVYFELKMDFQGNLLEKYKEKINSNRGIDAHNSCKTAFGCNLIYKEKQLAQVLPTNIVLPSDIKQKFRASNLASKQNSDDHWKGKEISSDEMSMLGVSACPPVLASNIEFPGLTEADANTYLVGATESSGLDDWFLFTGKACFKCGGIDRSMVAEVFSSTSSISVKILKTSNLKVLTSKEDSQEKIRLISGLRKSFKMAENGWLLNNTIDYLGEGGLVYRKLNGRKTISIDNTTMSYNGNKIDTDAFNEWLGYFDRMQRKVQVQNSEAIVDQLFETAASGKMNWFKEYRQNPLVFLSKYCQTERL